MQQVVPARIVHQLLLITVQSLQEVDGHIASVRQTAAELLDVVNVRVNQSGQDELAGAVDDLLRLEPPLDVFGFADLGDPVIPNGHRPVPDEPSFRVHRDDPLGVLDEDPAHGFLPRPRMRREYRRAIEVNCVSARS